MEGPLSDPAATLRGMTRIALFHSVLGIRQGIIDAAEVFRNAGHDVLVVDQYDGRSFDDYAEAGEFAAGLGFPQALMRSALAAIADDPGPLVAAGFSNGAGMAEYVTAIRGGRAGGVVGSLQFAGALPLAMLGVDLDYPGGHLFTDAARREEYDAHSTAEAFGRALDFLDRLDRESGER